ncbi:uncharacterized protein [Oryctolagus cuniculus]|uniref:uncharacterized protein n=1 Tax=Oryctolagus cuniculus TaxID=9986 RepID=UPI003879904E
MSNDLRRCFSWERRDTLCERKSFTNQSKQGFRHHGVITLCRKHRPLDLLGNLQYLATLDMESVVAAVDCSWPVPSICMVSREKGDDNPANAHHCRCRGSQETTASLSGSRNLGFHGEWTLVFDEEPGVQKALEVLAACRADLHSLPVSAHVGLSSQLSADAPEKVVKDGTSTGASAPIWKTQRKLLASTRHISSCCNHLLDEAAHQWEIWAQRSQDYE